MITLADIKKNTLRALRRTGNKEDEVMVGEICNNFYFELCASYPIAALRRRKTVDLSSTTYSSGMWLPANMSGMFRVKDASDGFDYINRDRAAVSPDEATPVSYAYVPSDDSLYAGTDGTVRQGGTTFESDALSADYTGEYIRFNSEKGFYLLTAAKTFTPAYWGDDIVSGPFVIRPRGTQKLVGLDASGDEVTNKSVYVDYWEYPQPLYQDTDMPLLPSTRALELKVMREAMMVIGRKQLSAGSYKDEIEEALNDLRKLCPPPHEPVVARDKFNKVFTLNTQIFTDRP